MSVFVLECAGICHAYNQVYHRYQAALPRHLLGAGVAPCPLNHWSRQQLHSLRHRWIWCLVFWTVVGAEEPKYFRSCVLMELSFGESFKTNLILSDGGMGAGCATYSAVWKLASPSCLSSACSLTLLRARCLWRQTGKGLLHTHFPPDKNCCCGLRKKEKSLPFVLPGNSNALRFSVTQDLFKR